MTQSEEKMKDKPLSEKVVRDVVNVGTYSRVMHILYLKDVKEAVSKLKKRMPAFAEAIIDEIFGDFSK